MEFESQYCQKRKKIREKLGQAQCLMSCGPRRLASEETCEPEMSEVTSSYVRTGSWEIQHRGGENKSGDTAEGTLLADWPSLGALIAREL